MEDGDNIFVIFLLITLILFAIYVYHHFITCNIAIYVIQLNKIYYKNQRLDVQEERDTVTKYLNYLAYYHFNPFFCYFLNKATIILQEEMSSTYISVNTKYKLGLPVVFDVEKERLVDESLSSLEEESL